MSTRFLSDMQQIKGEILKNLAAPEHDPLRINSLLNQFITVRNSAVDAGNYRVADQGALMLAGIAPTMFKCEEVAGLSGKLYFDYFETTMRAVFNIASDVKGDHKDALVSMGVDNLIKSDAFRIDSDSNIATGLIRNLLGRCTDKAPALKFCESILYQANPSKSGARTIIEAVFDITSSNSLPDKDAAARDLLAWIGSKEELIAPMVAKFPMRITSKERVDAFREAGLHSVANALYFRSDMLDAKELMRLNKTYGLKPDESYISQFTEKPNPEIKHLRELLKYSIAVENVFPAEFQTRQPWVVGGLVDAFKKLREAGIQPKPPAECQPLFAILSKHVKPSESVEPLMTKMISPYLEGSLELRGKMFTQALGV
jgi:hypothetical protein